MHHSFKPTIAAMAVAAGLGATPAAALTFGPDFAAFYVSQNLGTPPDFVGSLGGLTFAPGDPQTLWVGDRANTTAAAIHAVGVTRDGTGGVTGLTGPRALVTTAPGSSSGGIDGGIDFAPNGTLFYTVYSSNQIGQVKPGSTAPDRFISLNDLSIGSSVGTLRFVPAGFDGAGSLKVASYNTGQWYDVGFSLDPDGTYSLGPASLRATLSGGPEGIVYVKAGNPGFGADSVLVSEYAAGAVGAYEIDANGDPIAGTRRTFISGLSGAEGAAIDPLTGDFFFSTFGGGNNVIRVSGFTVQPPPPPPGDGEAVIPLPATAPLAAAALGLLALLRLRRRA